MARMDRCAFCASLWGPCTLSTHGGMSREPRSTDVLCVAGAWLYLRSLCLTNIRFYIHPGPSSLTMSPR